MHLRFVLDCSCKAPYHTGDIMFDCQDPRCHLVEDHTGDCVYDLDAPVSHHVTHQQDPADYTYIGSFYDGPSSDLAEAYAGEHRELADYFATGGDDWHPNVTFHDNGGCWLCGARFNHGMVFAHTNGLHVGIGGTCGQFVGAPDRATAIRTRNTRAATKAKEARERAERAAADWASVLANDTDLAAAITVDHRIIADIAAKGAKWGSITDRQRAFVLKLAAEATAEPTPPEVTAPVPADLRTVTGEIVSKKWKDNPFSYYGEGSWKITVKVTNADGTVFRVWGTLPSKIDDADRGDTVQFNIASVERSDSDEAFGFYKRPTRPVIVEIHPDNRTDDDIDFERAYGRVYEAA